MRQGTRQANPFTSVDEQEEVRSDKLQAITEVRSDKLQAVTTTDGQATSSVSPAVSILSRPPDTARRPIVIRPEKKRVRKALDGEAPGKHLSPRLRQAIVLLFTLVLLGGTLATLVPLANDQGQWNLSSGLGALIQTARTGLQSLIAHQSSQSSTGQSHSLPPMTIPRSQLVTLAEQDATAAGISPVYFVRQINLESGFNPNAVSPGGAEGIAQFEPSTAAGLGIDPFNPTQALKAAAQMMARYSSQYGGYDKALAAYNAGPASLQRAENSCGANWLSCMPAETQHYVATIMGS